MIRGLLVSTQIALASPAMALSCLPPDVTRTYNEAAEAKEAYIIVYGRLNFDETRLPKVDREKLEQTPHNTLIPAQLVGNSLVGAGFEQAFDQSITLNAQCFGPWCAGARSDTPFLAFLERTEDGYLLKLDPCGGFGFANPSLEMLEQVSQCFKDKACEPAPF